VPSEPAEIDRLALQITQFTVGGIRERVRATAAGAQKGSRS
jgi:hypothetical protein